MREPAGWARANPPGLGTMRRGAWYPVLEETIPHRVVLAVGRRNLVVHRELIELRKDRPNGFSVVRRNDYDRNPARNTPGDLGLVYAVCPWSGCRVRLIGHPQHLECPDCWHWAAVNWEDEC